MPTSAQVSRAVDMAHQLAAIPAIRCPIDRSQVDAMGGSMYQKFQCLRVGGKPHVFYLTGTVLRQVARENGVHR